MRQTNTNETGERDETPFVYNIDLTELKGLSPDDRWETLRSVSETIVNARDPDTTYPEETGYMRVMIPLYDEAYSSPRELSDIMCESLGVDSTLSKITEIDETNIVKYYSSHTGIEDVPPAFSEKTITLNLEAYLTYMEEGKKIYEYEIEWTPRWLKKLRGEYLDEAPEGWLPIHVVSDLKQISERTVRDFCTRKDGKLTATRAYGGVWHVKPDDKYDYWITRPDDNGLMFKRMQMLSEIIEDDPDKPMIDVWDELEKGEELLPLTGSYKAYGAKRYVERELKRLHRRKKLGWTEDQWKRIIPRHADYYALKRDEERNPNNFEE